MRFEFNVNFSDLLDFDGIFDFISGGNSFAIDVLKFLEETFKYVDFEPEKLLKYCWNRELKGSRNRSAFKKVIEGF